MIQPVRSVLSSSAFRSSLFLLLAASLTIVLYAPGLSGPFLFDDVHTVSKNERVKIEAIEVDGLRNAAESFVSGGRELAMVSFALNHYFLGPESFGFKIVNLAIHLVNGFLLYLLARTMLGLLVSREQLSKNVVLRWGPEVVVALWMINPINLTTVLYVSQRMNSLAAMFVLVGILVYVHARRRHLERGRYPSLSVVALIVCLWAAYQSKENGVLLLPFLALVEAMFFRFAGANGQTNRMAVLIVGTTLVAGALAAIAYEGLDISRIESWYAGRSFTLEERLLTQGRVLIFYIGLILFPWSVRLGLWHDDFEKSTSILVPFDTATSIALLILLFATAVLTWRKYPICSFGVLWFFVGHSMESTIFPLEMVHEHRNYLPSFGVIATLVGLLGYLQRARDALKIFLLASFAILSIQNLHERAETWRSEHTLSYHEFINHPNSARATFQFASMNLYYAGRGVELFREPALELFEHARDLGDETILPEIAMLVSMPVLQIDFDPEWIDSAIRKLSEPGFNASDLEALRGLTNCVANEHCDIEKSELMRLYGAAADTGRGSYLDEAARFYNVIGEDGFAFETLEQAAKQPNANIQIRLNYVNMLIYLGEKERARRELQEIEAENGLLFRHRQLIEENWELLKSTE